MLVRYWVDAVDVGPKFNQHWVNVSRGSAVRHSVFSARALVKKTQEPGIKLQKADFFSGMIPGHLPRRMPKSPQKSPLCIFLNSRWPPPCNAIFHKTGVYPNFSFLQLKKIFRCLYLCFKAQRVHPDDQK